MLADLVNYASHTLIGIGAVFVLIGAVGMVRMPDVYTRMHAASVIDTLGAGLLIVGLMMQVGPGLVTLKLLFILGLLFFFGPVATHALAQATLQAGIAPKLEQDRRGRPLGDRPATGSPAATRGRKG